MAFWDDVSRFFGNATGGVIGESDDERRKKQEEQARKAREAAARAVNKGNRDYTPNGVDQIGFNANRNSINTALDEGKTSDEIARNTGFSLETINDYADTTRPGYTLQANLKTKQDEQQQPFSLINPKPQQPQFKIDPEAEIDAGTFGKYKKQADGTYRNDKGQTSTADKVKQLKAINDKVDAQNPIHNSFWDYAGDVASAPVKVGVDIAHGIAQTPEKVFRSVLLEPLVGNATTTTDKAISTASDENTGLREFLYGKDAVTSYQEDARNAEKAMRASDNKLLQGAADYAPFIAPAMASLDLLTGGAAGKSGEVAAKKTGEVLIEQVVKNAEESLGRKLTREELDIAAREAEKTLAEKMAREATDTKVVDQVVKKTGDLPFNDVMKQADLLDNAAKDIGTDVVEQAPDAAEQLVKNADELTPQTPEAPKQTVNKDELLPGQSDRGFRVEATTEQPKPSTFGSNNAYMDAQDARLKERSQSTFAEALDSAKRELYDPRQVQQRLDNEEFARLKAEGKLLPGQKELLPEQSLATTRGMIENPNQLARQKAKQKYKVGDEAYSLEDIIKIYGKQDGPKARAFENYRIYKDELERIKNGADNTVGVDPKAMQDFVTGYERANPAAVRHNAVLRQISLDSTLRPRNEARIDAPGLMEAASKLEYYNPRSAVDPEDLIRPKMSGGVRSGAKGTELRSETSGGPVRSPLQLFVDNMVGTERALAEQRYGMLLRDKARSGTVPGLREVVNADTAIVHRQAINDMRQLSETIKGLQGVANGTKGELKNAKVVFKANKDAAKITRDYLKSQAVDEKGLKFAEKISDKEALDMFKLLTETGEVNGKRLINKMAKDTGVTPGEIQDFVRGVRAEIKDARSARSDAYSTMMDTTQNLERGTQTYTYKLDGETGKLEIPVDLAKELEKANEAFNASFVEKGMRGVAQVQKMTWTGALSPVFKTWNVLVKNPMLMYRNADGLSGIRPAALYGGIKDMLRTQGGRSFREKLVERGVSYENALQTSNITKTVADDIAARANIGTFFGRNPAHTMKDIWHGVDTALSHFDNAQRSAVAAGAYKRALKMGMPEAQALDYASAAPAKVFGDLNRVSRLARNAEIIIPYTGATQAGYRAMVRASKTKPVQTALKDATIVATAAGFTAYGIQNNKEYYDDMLAAGKEYELDNNWTIVLPGATKNEKGEWSGVIKIPLTPDFRPYNRATWRSVYDVANGEGVDAGMVAGELFNQFTADMSNNIYDAKKTDNGKNPTNGVLAGSPALNALKVGMGVDPRTGDNLADSFTATRPRTEQVYTNKDGEVTTSPAAIEISKAMGGMMTPIQIDAMLSTMGNTGKSIKDAGKDDGDPVSKFFNFGGPVTPGKSMTKEQLDGKLYGMAVDSVKSEIKDPATLKAFEALHSRKSAEQKQNMLNNSQKMYQFMSYDGKGGFNTTPLYEAERRFDEIQRSQGKPGNPLFDLGPQELQKVLTYRASKIQNAAKQNYTKDGEGMFQALGLDNQWYRDFQAKEEAFYAQLPEGDGEAKTFSGKPRPALSDEQKAIEAQYYALPEKSAERRALLAQNGWLKDYWAQTNDFTDQERKALGFDSLDGDGVFDGKSGSSWGSRGGGRGSSDGDRSGVLGSLPGKSSTNGLKDITPGPNKLVDVRKAVKQPRRASAARKLRITI